MSGYGGYNPNAPPGGSYGAPSAPPGGPRPGGVPPGGVHPGGVHPGGVHPGGVHPGGVHPGGVHPGGIHPGGVPPGGVPPGGSYGAGPPQGASYGGYAAQTAGYAAQPAGYGTPPGGYGGTAYQGAPVQPVAQQGPNLQQIFFSVDKDRSGFISVNELQSALSNGTWQPFNPETIRLMISMFDKDGNGTINFQEFGSLWNYINDWQKTFRYYDRDNSGSIDLNELQTAVASFGFRLSAKFFGLLMKKFDRTGSRTITFDDFIQCCVLIQTLSAAFQRKDTNRSGWIQINYEEFMELVFSTKI